MYTEKKCHRFTETTLPLPLTSDRDGYLLQVEKRIFENAFNCLYSHCSVPIKFNRCCDTVDILKSHVLRNNGHEVKYLHFLIKVPLCFSVSVLMFLIFLNDIHPYS